MTSDELRARIARAFKAANWTDRAIEEACKIILPLVEQAIQQECDTHRAMSNGLVMLQQAIAEKDAALQKWLNDAIERLTQTVEEAIEQDDQAKGMGSLGALGALQLIQSVFVKTPLTPQEPT
jgi:hypothetical protein